MFDNLFNVGTEWYVWAVKTSDGVILLNAGRLRCGIDSENLRKWGSTRQVKYVILHNAKLANYGAAKMFRIVITHASRRRKPIERHRKVRTRGPDISPGRTWW